MNIKATLNNHWYSKNRIYKNVQKFSFPRLAGTDGEKEAVKLTIDTFKEIGYTEMRS